MTHPRNAGYIKGDYWMRCDVCGFDFRFSQMRERWDGLWVCSDDYEERHPQEYVKGIGDFQAVPFARPDSINVFSTTTLSADMAAGSLSITVASVTGISDGDSIGIGLDNETIHWTLVNGDPDATLLTVPLLVGAWSGASSGNTVYARGSSFGTLPTASSL